MRVKRSLRLRGCAREMQNPKESGLPKTSTSFADVLSFEAMVAEFKTTSTVRKPSQKRSVDTTSIRCRLCRYVVDIVKKVEMLSDRRRFKGV